MTNITDYSSAQPGRWALWDERNQRELAVFTAFLELKFSSRARLPQQPLEQGGFFQYNKTATPSEVRVTLACQGDAHDQAAVLDELSRAVADTRLLTLQTPGHILSSMNLKSYDYHRRSSRGASLLVVELQLVEIRHISGRPQGLALAQVFLPADASALLRGRVQPRPLDDSLWPVAKAL